MHIGEMLLETVVAGEITMVRADNFKIDQGTKLLDLSSTPLRSAGNASCGVIPYFE